MLTVLFGSLLPQAIAAAEYNYYGDSSSFARAVNVTSQLVRTNQQMCTKAWSGR